MSTREAIEGSIRKWERIREAVEKGEEEKSIRLLEGPCPLCNERNFKVKCTGCVVEERTGQGNCYNTPYYAIYGEVVMLDRDAHENVRKQDISSNKTLLGLVDEMLDILKNCIESMEE
jgi:hypothetical protein